MHDLEQSNIIDSLVARLRQCTALGCDAIPNHMEAEIDDTDLAIYEEYVGSGRFQRVKRCALESLDLIREAVEPVDFTWNPGISVVEKEYITELYPIAKCALDCIHSQMDDVLDNASKYKEVTNDSSTLTFEGLFLVVKTILEMLDPVILGVEMTIFTMLLRVMERTKTLKTLLNACLACTSTYLCRLFASDISQEIQEGVTAISCRIKTLFEKVLSYIIESDEDGELNADAITFIKMVTNTIMGRLNFLLGSEVDSYTQEQINFVLRMVDCWYGVIVGTMMRLRSEMIHSNARAPKLARLMKAISAFPPLPAAHRLRLVVQIALTLRQDPTCSVQAEALAAIVQLMETDIKEKSDLVRNNVRPLAEALLEVLFDRKLCGNSHGANEKTDCEKQVQLVYCIAQCIRISRTMPRETEKEHVDEFLQSQILTLLNTRVEENAEDTARLEHMLKETKDLPELNSTFPTLEDFMNARDDCDMLTRLVRSLDYLLTYGNTALDEAIALVACWLFQEFEFSMCLKLVAPLCIQYLRTKRSKILDEIHRLTAVPSGLASISHAAVTRWIMGGRVFSTALEAYREAQKAEGMILDKPGVTLKSVPIFDTLLDATVDILKETAGNIPKDLEDCIGLYVQMFGFDTYIRLMPLNPLYDIPITSEMFKIGAHAYMLPVLVRQLKGVDMEVYMKHFFPVLHHVEDLEKRTKSCSSINVSTDAIISHALRSYEMLIETLYNILISMASAAKDCKEVLERNDFELLKHMLNILDKGTSQAIIASRFIASCFNLEGIAPKLIGLLVKRFVALETAIGPNNLSMNSTANAVEEALLAAIANCGKFCESEMLAENLASFEKALTRNSSSVDSFVKISRALLPSVEEELKVQLHKRWLDILGMSPSRSLYLALKRSCEIAEADLDHIIDREQGETGNSSNSTESIKKDFLFVKEMCSPAGLRSFAIAMHLLPDETRKEYKEQHNKHRICCINSYVRLIEKMKQHGLYGESTQLLVKEIMKPLIMESMTNAIAPNNITRSSALCIYDGLCNLMIDEIDDVLRLSLSALTCDASKGMQTSLVVCLTRLLAMHSEEAMRFNLAQVISYIFRLFSEDNIKLYVHLLRFARVCIVKFRRDRVQWFAPLLMRMFDNKSCCSRARIFVRRVVQKLLSKLTRDQLMKIFPPEHLPLLKSIMVSRRKKRNVKLRKVLRAREEDDDEEFVMDMFRTDDEGRLVLTMEESEEAEEDDQQSNKKSTVFKQQKKVKHKIRKHSDVQPYAYIKLNRSKVSEKHKNENIRALKSLAKGKGPKDQT